MTKLDENGLLPENRLPEHGPRGEGVDPLTTGNVTYGEDVKGNSKLTEEEPEPQIEEPTEVVEGEEPVEEAKDATV